jgi:hypothetical protein
MTLKTRFVFYTVRLPLILGLMMLGFILEFAVELPFRALMWGHGRFRNSAGRKR